MDCIPYRMAASMENADHLKILAAKLKGARLKANAQRRRALSLDRAPQRAAAKRYQPLTQGFVARELGISQSFLSKLENGEQEPNFLLVERLARYYGVKLAHFATYTFEETKLGHHLND